MDLWCYAITHDGEGEPGEKVLVLSGHGHRDPEFYAQEAAEYFHDQEKRQEGMDDSAFHGTSMVVEVRGYPGKPALRFRVHCLVMRSYYAVPCPASPAPTPAAPIDTAGAE
jgi:hypothetical protein